MTDYTWLVSEPIKAFNLSMSLNLAPYHSTSYLPYITHSHYTTQAPSQPNLSSNWPQHPPAIDLIPHHPKKWLIHLVLFDPNYQYHNQVYPVNQLVLIHPPCHLVKLCLPKPSLALPFKVTHPVQPHTPDHTSPIPPLHESNLKPNSLNLTSNPTLCHSA